jgi:hypothetical protein
MNDRGLADEIKQQISKRPTLGEARWVMLNATEWRQIIAALRRGSEPVPEGFVRTVPDPQMRTICTAEAMGQLAERPPSSEMVMAIVKAVVTIEYNHWVRNSSAIKIEDAPKVALDVQRSLSTAEVKGRKG